jgi:hypothetical protein
MPVAQTEVIIDAPIERVWDVMLDIHRYPEWNPFVVKIDCAVARPEVGTDFILNVQFKGAKKAIKTWERVSRLDKPAMQDGALRATLEYEFLGPLHNMKAVRGKRQQILRSLPGGKTRYNTYEKLNGWLAWATPIAKVQDGFERHAAALRNRCEALRNAA